MKTHIMKYNVEADKHFVKPTGNSTRHLAGRGTTSYTNNPRSDSPIQLSLYMTQVTAASKRACRSACCRRISLASKTVRSPQVFLLKGTCLSSGFSAILFSHRMFCLRHCTDPNYFVDMHFGLESTCCTPHSVGLPGRNK